MRASLRFASWMVKLSPRRRRVVLHAAIIAAGFVFAVLVNALGMWMVGRAF